MLTLYYHKNMMEGDEHVEGGVYSEAYKQFSTPDSLKKLLELKTPGTHFIGSEIKSKATEVVKKK